VGKGEVDMGWLLKRKKVGVSASPNRIGGKKKMGEAARIVLDGEGAREVRARKRAPRRGLGRAARANPS